MDCTPLVRWKNFTVDNLKLILDLYKDEYKNLNWKQTEVLIENELKGYIKTAYQFAGQLGLEYREGNKLNLFRVHKYLKYLNGEELQKYLEFWFTTYYVPNPRVKGDNEPICVYTTFLEEILGKPNYKITQEESTLFDHGSEDILRNCFINLGIYINYNKTSKEYSIEDKDIENVKEFIAKIKQLFPIPRDYNSSFAFFKRYSKKNFDIFCNLDIDKPYNRIIYGAPGTGKSYQLDKETKDFSKLITQEKEQNESNILKPNYWIATCGENNHLWDDFIKDKIYAVGWDQLEDLKQYKSKKEIEEKIEEFGYPNKSGSNQWNIGHLLKEGDIIAIRKGIKGQLEGYGTVDGKYKYDSARDSFKHTISIRWEKTKNMKLSTYNKNFPIQSLVEMNSELKKSFKEECLSKDTSEEFETKSISTVSRVTFYDGYTHGQFVGTYKPVPSGEGVSYKYVAGPFIKQLIEAIRNPNDNYCLVIEEINRARADKVFGNIFQLLDRDSSGKSQYPIELSEDQLNYFTEKLESEYSEELKNVIENGLYIPSNLYIWATMNSADQGVYPLDSAFKRRWNFEHIGLDENEDKFKDGPKKLSIFYETIFDNDDDYIHKGIEWNDFRKVINNKLLDEGIQEDRLIAPFFIKPNQFIREKDIDLDLEYLKDVYELEPRIYIDKVVMYLFEDVLRHKKKCILFNESYKSFSQLKKDYKEKIENKTEFSIFNNEIRDELRKFKIQDPEVVEKEAE